MKLIDIFTESLITMHAEYEHCKSIISGDHPTNESQGELEGEFT
jgi:hypothetical protein